MIRKIININQERCNGCGLCVNACHEGAIGIVGGKATLLRDDYCDGLGDCLPVCPTDAISFVEREALEYNEVEVNKNIKHNKTDNKNTAHNEGGTLPCGCPSSNSKTINHDSVINEAENITQAKSSSHIIQSKLNQWPVQIKLVPMNAPYFENANLLVSADCAAYAYGNFHNEFMENRITLIGCPKLDEIDYSDKLTNILKMNNIKSVTVVRMEVPCCGGIENAVKTALKKCDKMIPWQVVTVTTDGKLL